MHRRPTTQDVTWFLDQNRNKQLVLDPPFQRRSIWTMKDRRFFIDTILTGYPCPAIFLHKRMEPDGRAVYEVVDGKQRLETILKFAANEITVPSDFPDARFAGKSWTDLGPDLRRVFWDYVLPVEYLDFSDTETETVNEAFDRLNRNSRKLEPQELRHARYDGWFITFIEQECASTYWKDLKVVTTARQKRMKDAQFVSELLLVVIEGKQAGFSQEHLDSAYAKYEEPDEEGVTLDTEEVEKQFEAAKEFLTEMDKKNACVRAAASNIGAFYTLWSIIVLRRGQLPAADETASKYADFVERVATIKKEGIPPGTPDDDPVTTYAKALQGAVTDLAPREARFNACFAALRAP